MAPCHTASDSTGQANKNSVTQECNRGSGRAWSERKCDGAEEKIEGTRVCSVDFRQPVGKQHGAMVTSEGSGALLTSDAYLAFSARGPHLQNRENNSTCLQHCREDSMGECKQGA